MHYMDIQFKSSLGFLWDVDDKFVIGALQVLSMPKQLAETRPSELDTLYVYVHFEFCIKSICLVCYIKW